MIFNMKMFNSEYPFATNRSVGYESVLAHSHSFVEVVYIESGNGVQKLNNKAMKLKSGDVFIIANDAEHSIIPMCAEEKFRIVNVIFEKSVVDFDYSQLDPELVIKTSPDDELVCLIYKVLAEYENKQGKFDLRIKGLIHLILADFLECASEKNRVKKKKYKEDYVNEATKFIHEHYNEKIKLDTIATNVGVTSGYLQKIFREERNTSLIEYLLRYRVEQACKMIVETDYSIQEICLRIGFSDVKNFHYRFRQIFGVTPNEYRKAHKEHEYE